MISDLVLLDEFIRLLRRSGCEVHQNPIDKSFAFTRGALNKEDESRFFELCKLLNLKTVYQGASDE